MSILEPEATSQEMAFISSKDIEVAGSYEESPPTGQDKKYCSFMVPYSGSEQICL
ncbi:hypothetical protein SORBI_3005G104001 [Sorghum bicolor]|uniref:Uncharacterized protein n=1 Tax=Sorghum bicolor TaxID=4558 RepID=A0A1Z5RHZ4_SORBI|nr:hypothetical protein SORBI_3005G104001 [Sorghum bicolor]